MEVKKFNQRGKRKFTLLSILKRIAEGETPYNIYKSWGWSRKRLDYYLKMLIDKELIRLKIRTSVNKYELTPQGENFYTRSMQNVPLGQLELHKIGWKYTLKKVGNLIPDKITEKNLSIKRFKDVTIMWSSEHLMIYIVKKFGNDPFKMQDEASDSRDSIAIQLRKDGFEIENPVLMSKMDFGVIDPVATEVSKYATIKSNDFDINASNGYGELEFHNPQDVQDYVTAIKGIARILPSLKESIELEIQNKKLHLEVLNDMKETLKEIRDSLKK